MSTQSSSLSIFLFLSLFVLCSSLPYQAHGFNDLDYFVQILQKGVQAFKLDLSMVQEESCLSQSTWNRTLNDCFFDSHYPQTICCLGFRGDTSSTPNYQYPFNTSYEFLSLLTRPDVQPLLKKHKIFIAINFQYKDSQNNLTKMFLYTLMKTIKDKNLTVTIATGTDNMILDYDYKCIIAGKCKDDPISKYISDSDIVLQSGSYEPYHPHDVKKRYRNFNVYYKQIVSYCAKGFPSWVDNYPDYPVIFWEPSDELNIQFVLETFLSSACKRPQKHNTIDKLAIASNLDPEMFSNYLQNYRFDYGYGVKSLLKKSNNQYLTQINVDGKPMLLVAYKSLDDGSTRVEIRDPSTSLVVNQIIQNQTICALVGDGDTFFMCALMAENNIQFRQYDNNLQLIAKSYGTDFLAITYNNGIVHYIRNISSGYYNYGTFNIATKTQRISGCSLSFRPSGMVVADQIYIVGSKNNTNTSRPEIWLSYNFTTEVMVGFGANPKITKSMTQDKVSNLHIIIHDGPCQSAAWVNNNDMNKCVFWKYPEFQSLVSVPGLVSHIWGSVEKFDAIKNTTQSERLISGCSKQGFKAAKVFNGNSVSHTVIGNKVFAAYEYLGITSQSLISSLFCGASNFDNYLDSQHVVLGSFELMPNRIQQSDVEI